MWPAGHLFVLCLDVCVDPAVSTAAIVHSLTAGHATLHSSMPIPSHVALDAGAGRRPLGAGSAPAAKSATAPPLHPTRVPRASAQWFYTYPDPRSCSVTPRTRDRHFRRRRPDFECTATTFKIGTGDDDGPRKGRCAPRMYLHTSHSVPEHTRSLGHTWFGRFAIFTFCRPGRTHRPLTAGGPEPTIEGS